LLAVPLLLLFEGSLVLMRLTEKRRKAEAGKPEEPQSAS
jgi:sec-independent protein translocase protein TatC